MVRDPHYGQRAGQLYWLRHPKDEVLADLHGAGFEECKVWDCDVNWFGSREALFIFAARKP